MGLLRVGGQEAVVVAPHRANARPKIQMRISPDPRGDRVRTLHQVLPDGFLVWFLATAAYFG